LVKEKGLRKSMNSIKEGERKWQEEKSNKQGKNQLKEGEVK